MQHLIAQALDMGDEVHNRNVAASSLLLKRLAPALLQTDLPKAQIAETLGFIAANDHFFLNLSMAACKAMLDAAADVPDSSMVVAMARNGVEFGIRLSGTGSAEGQFAEGSMAPKIRAIVGYLDRPGRRGLITDPPNIGRALAGEAGTVVTFDEAAG